MQTQLAEAPNLCFYILAPAPRPSSWRYWRLWLGLPSPTLEFSMSIRAQGMTVGPRKIQNQSSFVFFSPAKLSFQKGHLTYGTYGSWGGPSPRLKVAPSSLPKSIVCPSRSFGIPSSSRAAATRPGPSIGLSAPDSACKAKSKETWAAFLC